MKKYISVFAAVLMVITACSKTEIPVETPKPVKMTLTASIGADTKVSYTDENNGLKTSWEQYDKVSLLAVDVSGNLISNDIFTATSAGNTVEFDGEFTNDPATAAVYVYYPALAQGDGSDGTPYAVYPPDTYNDNGVLYGVKKGGPYLSFDTGYQLQNANASTSHLAQYAVMSGKADFDALSVGNMSVILKHRSYVVKATLKLPATGLIVYSAKMDFNLQSPSVGVGGFGWTYINETDQFPGNSRANTLKTLLGADIVSGNGTGVTLESDELVVYFQAYAAEFWSVEADSYLWTKIKAGDKVSVEVKAQDGTYVCKDIEFTKETLLENGKMYRTSATLELAVPED